MPELSLTSWLDPIIEFFDKTAPPAGEAVPRESRAIGLGGEALGVGEEAILDFLGTGLLGKIVQCVTGAGCILGATFSKDISRRLKNELYVWGVHSISRVIDPKPSDILELRIDIDKLVAGLKLRDAGRITDALLRSPEELKAMIATLTGPRYAVPTGAPPAAPPTAPPTVPTPPAPVKQFYA